MTFCIFDVIFSWLFKTIFIFTRSNWEDCRNVELSNACGLAVTVVFFTFISVLIFFKSFIIFISCISCRRFSASRERSRDLTIFDSRTRSRESMIWICRSLSNLSNQINQSTITKRDFFLSSMRMHILNRYTFFLKQFFLNFMRTEKFSDNDKNFDASWNHSESINQLLVLW